MWRKLGAAAAIAAGILAVSAPAAHAEDPVELNGAYVLDTVGAISGDESRVQAAIDSLYERAGIQLFVVYVDSFTGASDGDWATQTALQNGLGTSDVLLAIATQDRKFEISVADDFTLDDSQLGTVETDFLIPELRNDRWADAAVAAASGYASEASGGVVDNTPSTISPVVPIIGGVAALGIGVFVVSRIRKRRSNSPGGSVPDQLSQKDLDFRAGSLLVQLDDSLKTSEQELGFAIAQFGDAATAGFAVALDSARQKVAEAFRLRQKLDDSEQDSEVEKRTWTTTIIQLCEAADAELDAQADAFDALRELEKNAPQALAEVVAATETATARAQSAQKSLAGLQLTYLPAALGPVIDNISRANVVLGMAATATKRAREAIEASSGGEAAIAVRTAQASVGQASELFDAIDSFSRDLAEAGTALEAAIADTTQDIAAARALPQDAAGAATATVIASAEDALTAVTKANPIASLGELQKANNALEQLVTGVRDQQEQFARATRQLDATLASARAQITSTLQYISTRRGGIGSVARTRVSEAERLLVQATTLAATDPVAALADAQQANQFAATAFQSAQGDVAVFERRQSVDLTPPRDSAFDSELGGIVGWLFDSSSSQNSNWSGGSGGSRSSSRSSRSGSFGGSSRSSGRSSSRSSGGRSSRGGRF